MAYDPDLGYDPSNDVWPPPAPAGDPWTPAELAESQNWANNYWGSHQIPQDWGSPDDLGNNYLYQRKQGVGHQAAMDMVPGLLGWDKYTPPAAPTPKPVEAPAPPPAPTGGGAPAPPAPTAAPAPTPPPAPAPSGAPPPATIAPPSVGGPAAPPPVAPPDAGPGPAAGPSPQQQQADELFAFLMSRAKQSQKIDPNDPMIRAQADNYSANLTRGGRRYLSELAERKGAGGNIGAESRMMAEKNSQASAAHEGELLQHESDQRRQEIEHALSTGAQFMTAQQQMALQKELAAIDQRMKLYQTQVQERQFGMTFGQNADQFARTDSRLTDEFGRTLANQNDQFGRTLGQNESQFGRTYDLQNRTLSQQAADAAAGRAQSGSQFGQTMSQREREFNDNLRQRAYEFSTDDEFRRSPYAQR